MIANGFNHDKKGTMLMVWALPATRVRLGLGRRRMGVEAAFAVRGTSMGAASKVTPF